MWPTSAKMQQWCQHSINETFDPPVQFKTFHMAIVELNALYTMVKAAVKLTIRLWSYKQTSGAATLGDNNQPHKKLTKQGGKGFCQLPCSDNWYYKSILHANKQQQITRLMEKVMHITSQSWIPLWPSFLVFGTWTKKNLSSVYCFTIEIN